MLFEEIRSKSQDVLRCDNCKEEFKAKDMVLSDMVTNITFLTPLAFFTYVDAKGQLISSSIQPSKENKALTCPLCNSEHLFGFDVVKENENET